MTNFQAGGETTRAMRERKESRHLPLPAGEPQQLPGSWWQLLEEEEEKDLSPTLAEWHDTDTGEERSWDWDLQEGNVCVCQCVCGAGGG